MDSRTEEISLGYQIESTIFLCPYLRTQVMDSLKDDSILETKKYLLYICVFSEYHSTLLLHSYQWYPGKRNVTNGSHILLTWPEIIYQQIFLQ